MHSKVCPNSIEILKLYFQIPFIFIIPVNYLISICFLFSFPHAEGLIFEIPTPDIVYGSLGFAIFRPQETLCNFGFIYCL